MFEGGFQSNEFPASNRAAGSSGGATDVLQASLWKHKSTIIGQKWKRKWISTDGVILSQWVSDELPKKATAPRHTYSLQRCSITEEPGLRPYAFKLSDRKTADSIVLACDNMADYLTWYTFITTPRDSSSSEAVDSNADGFMPMFSEGMRRGSRRDSDLRGRGEASQDSALTAPSGPEPVVAAAIIKQIFIERSPDANLGFFIRERDFWDLLRETGIHIDQSVAERGLDALKKKTGFISYEDFVHWWNLLHSKKPSRGSTRKIAESLQSVAAAENGGSSVPGAGAHLETESIASSSMYYDVKPAKNSSSMRNVFGGDTAHLVGIIDCDIMAVKDTALLARENTFSKNKLPSVNSVLSEWSVAGYADWNNRFQLAIEAVMEAQTQLRNGTAPISADPLRQQDSSTVLGSYFSFFSIYGNFLAAVSKGVRVVVDEYSLPVHLRKSQLVKLRENESADDPVGALDDDMYTEELFFYDGLVFRLIAAPLTSRDLDATYHESYVRQVHLSNDMRHKMIGNELRAYNAVQNAIFALQGEAVNQNKVSHFPSTMLQTIVDYGGYRVHAFCPMRLSEETLRYGFTDSDGTFKHFVHEGVPSDPYHDVCSLIAKKLNVEEQNVNVLSSFVSADAAKQPTLQRASEIMFGEDVQFHEAEDQRHYLVNFGKILPPDLPRFDSNDVLTRCLRPEFVRNYRAPLSRRALFDEVDEFVDENRSEAIQPAETLLDACVHLRTNLLLKVTRQIDLLVVCPADSYGFTQYIHSQGVNCRYIGAMHALSSSFHTRQLLLCEAVARTAKVLLRQAIQHIMRKGRAESFLAEERGKSRDENFFDHQRNVIKARDEAIVDIFNLVLGKGASSEEFWNGVLSNAVKSKFNMTIPNFVSASAVLSSSQLFHALEYHCSVYFNADKNYDFTSQTPFQSEDLMVARPKVKVSIAYPGSEDAPMSVIGALIQERMFQDALSLLRLHASSLVMLNSGNDTLEFVSPVFSYLHLNLGYLMGLCMFHLKNYESSINLLRAYKDSSPRNSFLEARFTTLLMAALFKYKNSSPDSFRAALDFFETGSVVYSTALGLKHPYHGLHVNALADLYFLVQAIPQAKATLMIAFELFQSALGRIHPVCAGMLTKIGILLLVQGQVNPAIESFSSAIAVYEEINKTSSDNDSADQNEKPVYIDDQSHCMHALALALNMKGDTKTATSTAFKAIDIVTTAGRIITPSITHNLLLLAELLEFGGDYSAAVTLYQDVWDVVKQSPKSYHMSVMLVDLASRLIHTTIDSLPLASRVLLETIRADQEVVDASTWNGVVSAVCDDLWNDDPCNYIIRTINKGLEFAAVGDIFSLSSRLGKVGKGVVGVPFGGKADTTALAPRSVVEVADPQTQRPRSRTQPSEHAEGDFKDSFTRRFSGNSRAARSNTQTDAPNSTPPHGDDDFTDVTSKDGAEKLDESTLVLLKLKVLLRLGMKNADAKQSASNRR